ncbi:unnamed protein product [Calypogeia fissa]
MKQVVAKGFVYVTEFKHPVTFKSVKENVFQIRFVSSKVVRVLFSPANCSTARWEASESPIKLSIDHDIQQKVVYIRTPSLHVKVDYADGLSLSWTEASSSRTFAKDIRNRAYVFDGNGVFHYMCRKSNEVYCGLGERTGNLNLYGRRFRLEGFDSMGYDAERTDPLYKHCPFYLTLSKESGIAYGLFYNNMSRTVVDLGAEIDAFWGSYRYYHAEFGPLDYYLFFGPSVQTVLDGFALLMGHPRSLPPRYSLGFLASSMSYAEAEDAQERIEAFPELCRLHDIPCDGMHLSSGYTVNKQGERCVFTWNTERFPNAKRLIEKLKAQGINVIANIKPWLLEEHAQYERLKASKGFIWDAETDQPARVLQWSAGASTCSSASYIDFTSSAGYSFWKKSVKESLLEYGVSGCWNDNNEFTFTDDTNTFAMEIPVDVETSVGPNHGFASKQPKPARQVGAPIQTLLMAQCSYQAMEEWAPKQRPFVVTRSASPWCHQFAAQTWSGDNSTDWKTLKFNIPMGLSAGLSAFPAGYGHDVGGFAGPKPSAQLLQRWVQAGVLNPRFCIHSWNSDNTVTEPWMYESAIPGIRSSMHFRMRLIPYLYALHVEFQRTSWPIMRPLFWHFQHDPRTFELGFEYMLGSCMLVAPVWQEGALTRTVYLPRLLPVIDPLDYPLKGDVDTFSKSRTAIIFSNRNHEVDSRCGWFSFLTGEFFKGAREVTVEAPIEADLPPVFVPEGGMLQLGKFMHYTTEVPDDERVVLLFPSLLDTPSSCKTEISLIDDDGVTTNHLEKQEFFEAKIWMETSPPSAEVKVGIEIVHAGFRPAYSVVWVVVATKEWNSRSITIDQVENPPCRADKNGRTEVGIPLNQFLDR